MQKVLNQQQIDAMVRQARSGGRLEVPPERPKVEPWDVRRSGQIGREHLEAITLLHEGFARNLTHSLGAYFAGKLLYLPVAGKMKLRIREEQITREMTLEGVASILEGVNPRMLQTKLLGFLVEAAEKIPDAEME